MVEERVKDATKILNLMRSMSDYRPHFEIMDELRTRCHGVEWFQNTGLDNTSSASAWLTNGSNEHPNSPASRP